MHPSTKDRPVRTDMRGVSPSAITAFNSGIRTHFREAFTAGMHALWASFQSTDETEAAASQNPVSRDSNNQSVSPSELGQLGARAVCVRDHGSYQQKIELLPPRASLRSRQTSNSMFKLQVAPSNRFSAKKKSKE